mgnify:FL=1
MESGPSREILRSPQHPYTRRLVDAAPSLASSRIRAAKEAGVEAKELKTGEANAADGAHSSAETSAVEPGAAVPLSAQSTASDAAAPGTAEPVISVRNLTKEFNIRGQRGEKKHLKAVDDVSFDIRRGTTLALVGESGSGKSTVANMVLGLLEPTSGTIEFEGRDTSTLSKKELFNLRRKMQVVFQNPYGSLDPMYSIYKLSLIHI